MDGTSIGGNALHLSPTAIVDETNDASRTVLAQGIISKILQEFINKKVLSKFHTVPVNQSFDFFDVNMTIREVDMDSLQASNLQVKITAVKLSGVSVGASTVAT